MAKPTPTLVRLHIDQGYLGRARTMLDALSRGGTKGPVLAELEARWRTAAEAARREAAIEALRRLLARVRRVRLKARSS